MLIARLKNQIATLEKANFRLQIDKRDAAKDNKTLRRRSRTIQELKTLYQKEELQLLKKKIIQWVIIYLKTLNIQRKSLLDKFNQQKYESEDIGSNSASVIFNSSDIEECSGKKRI